MAGALDPKFNGTGMVGTPFPPINNVWSFAVAQAVAVQRDQKILAVGWSGTDPLAPDAFSLARYKSDGSLDPTFGVGGEQTTNFQPGSNDVAYAVAIDSADRIIAAGYSGATGGGDFGLARYDKEGNLDLTFGNQGTVTTDFGGVDFATGVAVQKDGKVAAGTSNQQGGNVFALARYKPNGHLDPTFGNNGLVTTAFGLDTRGFAMAIQRDGRIVVVGIMNTMAGSQFALARYTTDGSLDQGFGKGGRVITKFIGTAEAHAVAIQPNGRIVAGGWAFYRGRYWFALARYMPDGTLDLGFGLGGTLLTNILASAQAYALAIQKDRIVAAGKAWPVFPPQPNVFPEYDFALARYKQDGSLDPGFGVGGTVTTTIKTNMNILTLADMAYGLAIQKNGNIVAAGWVELAGGQNTPDYFALARYL